MNRKLLYATLVAALAAVAVVAFALPAGAAQRTFKVRLATGDLITVSVEAPCVPMDQVGGLPGTPVEDLTPPEVCGGGQTETQPQPPPPPPPGNDGDGNGDGGNGDGDGNDGGDGGNSGGRPNTGRGNTQDRGGSRDRADRDDDDSRAEGEGPGADGGKDGKKRRPTRRNDGVPTPSNPTYFDALPGPSRGVPNFVINKFKVPIFLLPIYQAAGIQYGVDANEDGKRDPYNPVDAIFAAARYLKAAGAEDNLRKAIFAYNHANWYVDSVMLRARLIAGYPPDFVGSLTGLTEGRFPVAARAKYADDAAEAAQKARVKAGRNAARVVESDDSRTGIDIFTREGAAVVATHDGIVKKIGYSKARGRYMVLQDVYGNQYTYNGLGSIQRMYPVPKQDAAPDRSAARAIAANAEKLADPKPTLPASAGTQSRSTSKATPAPAPKKQRAKTTAAASDAPAASKPTVTYKARLFAHPQRPNSRRAGGLDQVFAQQSGDGFTTYDNFFAGKVGLNAKNATLRPLKKGSKVVAGTVLARVGKTEATKAPHVHFQIRPAGKGAPQIDPKPILDGWKLLESTAVYRASGKNALYGESSSFSIGQVLLMPKPLLMKRVLADPRIEIYPGGRQDIRAGQIDRRVLATLEYLAEIGLEPTVTSLRAGHSYLTASGNVSAHSSGNAVDIAKINGVPILGHQDEGGVTEVTVKRLMLLQGTMAPNQIISLLDFGGNTMSLSDHADHIHVGWQPLFGANSKLGEQTAAILKPGQWENLVERLNDLPNPVVPTKPSKYALPAKGDKNSD